MSGDRNNPRDKSLVNQAAKESRAMEARMLPTSGELTQEQLDYVRKRVDERCDEQSLNYEQIDKKVGVSRKAVRRFMEDRYEHNDTIIARKLDRWLRGSEGGVGEMPGQYVSTDVAEKMIGVIKQIYRRKSMGAIVGPSGTSKTTVLKALVAMIPNSAHIEFTHTDGSPSTVLRRLSAELGLNDRYTTYRMMQNLTKTLKDSDRLIMLDEVHYLTKKAMNIIRDIHKQTGCPIVLVGTQDLLETIDDFDQFHGQMKSLVSMTYNITAECMATGEPLYSVDDIKKYATAMKIKIDLSGADFVASLASTLGWGGLRSAAYLLLNANMLAKDKTVTVKHLNSALREMEGYDGFQRTKQKQTQSRKAAVA